MPKYLIIRSFEVGEEKMPPIVRRSVELAEEEFPQIRWEHSHVVVDADGLVHTFCIYHAPNEGVLREHARRLGKHTLDAVHELAGDVTPADYPHQVPAGA